MNLETSGAQDICSHLPAKSDTSHLKGGPVFLAMKNIIHLNLLLIPENRSRSLFIVYINLKDQYQATEELLKKLKYETKLKHK